MPFRSRPSVYPWNAFTVTGPRQFGPEFSAALNFPYNANPKQISPLSLFSGLCQGKGIAYVATLVTSCASISTTALTWASRSSFARSISIPVMPFSLFSCLRQRLLIVIPTSEPPGNERLVTPPLRLPCPRRLRLRRCRDRSVGLWWHLRRTANLGRP